MKASTRVLVFAALAAWVSAVGSARAATVVWSENFDDGNGNNRWYADHGVWQIGSPTLSTGPAVVGGCRAHSCPNCATTGSTGNYPRGTTSRLIRIQPFSIPSAGQFPRLRFWQWYNFDWDAGGCGDYGVVEVRIGSGDWQEVSPRYYRNGGDWTYTSVDLSAYAGTTVQVAFEISGVTGGTCGGAPGWYVDNVVFETGTPVFNNPEGWESGIGDWYAETGLWQVGIARKAQGASADSLGYQAHSGTNCGVTLLSENYPAESGGRLVSPPFQLPPQSTAPQLRFWQWYNFYSDAGGCGDWGEVQVKAGTNGWQSISPAYQNYGGAWSEPYFDLTAYGGMRVQLAFHTTGVTGWLMCGSDQGWYVDDIEVLPYVMPVGSILSAIPDTNILAELLWQYTPAVLGGTYTFGVTNGPPGLTVDATNGTISWTPLQTQSGPTFQNVTYLVYQGGALIASTSFNISVIPQPPHAATATPTLANGFLVGLTIIDQGAGYTNTPTVRVIGGGGSGAQATAVVSNGVVVEADVVNPGNGYTSAPVVVIEPPFIPNPVLSIAPLSFLSFSNLTVGSQYQLQQWAGYYWSNQPLNFTATNVLYTQLVTGAVNSGDFQLALSPVPLPASATAQVVNGFVIGVTVTSGGSGYPSAPAVTFVGDGSNAVAVASISGAGVVTNITVLNPGSGYDTGTTVEIAPPPNPAVSPTVWPMMQLGSAGLAPYDRYQIESSPSVGPGAVWQAWPGGLFSPTDVTNQQVFFVTNNIGFFRLHYLGR